MKTGKIIIGVLSIIIGIVTLIESNDVYRLASAFGVNGFHIYVGFIVGFIFIGVGVSSLLMMDKQSKLYAETTLSLSSVAFFLCFRGPELFTDLLFFAIWSAICFVFAIFAYYGTKKHDGNGKYDQLATNQLTCPYCSAVVDEGTVFCGSCGKKIKRNCPQCGAELNTSDVFCPNCGIQLNENNTVVSFAAAEPQQGIDFNDNSSNDDNNRGNLIIRWDGAWALIDTKVRVLVNGNNLGEFSFKEGFEISVPNTSSETIVVTKVGLYTTKEKLDLNPNENYTYELAYHRMSGWFGFILYDNDGNEIRRDKLHWGMWILSFLIPLAGFVYAIVGWKKRPASSYTSIYAALLGFIVTFTASYHMENMRSELRSMLDNYKNRNNTTLVQDTDSIKDDLVINETEGISDADIQLIKDWYKYVFGDSPTENVMKKYLSPNVMQKIWGVDYEETYSYWRFRTAAQDSKPDNDISEVEEITSEGGGWYTVTYKDMGWDGKTKLKVIDGKIVDFEKDVSWKSWDNEKVEDSKDNSASMVNANDAESQLHNFGYNSKYHHHLKGTFEDATGIYLIELDFNSSGREVSDVIYKNVKVGSIIRMTCTYFDFNNITVKGKDRKNDFTISLECINMNSFKGTAIDGSKEFVVKMEANCQHE